jgi:glycosyltransferase involved in cell wall biosynthesis
MMNDCCEQRIGVVSSWNVKCGIAEYCGYLLAPLAEQGFRAEIFSDRVRATTKPDETCVHRVWDNNAETVPDLVSSIVRWNVDYVLIQYHHAFYSPQTLASIIEHLSALGLPVFVIYHATFHEDLRAETGSLAKVALNLVHSVPDVDRLASYGLRNVRILRHGICAPRCAPADAISIADGFSIGSFGFLMPHKGFLELICAAYLLRKHIPGLRLHLYASLYPNAGSEKLLTRCREYIRYLGCPELVKLETGFLDIHEVIACLQRCQLLVFPYQNSKESSSAAVRTGLASGRPVLCTPLEIFGDAAEVLHYSKGFDPFAIANAILERYRDPEVLDRLQGNQDAYLQEHSWTNIARTLAREMATYRLRDPQLSKVARPN